MKKLVSLAVVFVMMFSLATMSNATVQYDEKNNAYNSTSEKDGTIAIGCTVYNEDGSVYGTGKGDGKYLENIVPVTEDTLRMAYDSYEVSIDKEVKSLSKTVDYTPSNDSLVIKLNSSRTSKTSQVKVNIIDKSTGKVIARGYNLNENQAYETAINVSGMPLEIEVLSDELIQEAVSLSMTSKSNDEALKLAETVDELISLNNLAATTRTQVVTTQYITSYVPVNIDGNQGQFLINHTVQGDPGHRVPQSKYVSGTNSMSSVNMAMYYSGIKISYIMNLAEGRSVDWKTSVGVGDTVNFKMSTNSNSGKATVNITDDLY